MPKKNPLQLDFEKFKNKIEKIPITKLDDLDEVLYDIHVYIYDAYELVCELPDKIKRIKKYRAEKLKTELLELKKKITLFMDFLDTIQFESKWMDRVEHMMGTMEEEIPKLTRKLRKLY